MPRFTIKSLMYLTMVVAAFALILAEKGPTPVAFLGFVAFFSLIALVPIWEMLRPKKRHDERRKVAREVDVSNPTT
jgi:hypothetical protein